MDLNALELGRETVFKDAVLSQAEARSMEIIAEAGQDRDRQLKEATASCEEADYAKIKAQLSKNIDRSVAAAAQKARRELLQRRVALVDEIFAAVRQNLLDFTKTESYPDFLAAKLRGCAARAETKGPFTVLLAARDLPLQDRLAAALPGAAFEASPRIEVGGLSLRDGHRLYDETLDSALEAQREAFTMNGELSI